MSNFSPLSASPGAMHPDSPPAHAPAQTAAAAPTRRRLAFVPDIDELFGGAARGSQQIVQTASERVCDLGRLGINAVARKPVISPAQASSAAYGLGVVAGQGVLLAGAWLAISACSGARENIVEASERREEWLRIASAQQALPGAQAASAHRLAQREATAALWQQRAYAASAVGAAAMAAVLLVSTAPVLALGSWVAVVNAAAMGTAVVTMGAYGLIQATLACQRILHFGRIDARLARLEAARGARAGDVPTAHQLASVRALSLAPAVVVLTAAAVACSAAIVAPPGLALRATFGCAAAALATTSGVLVALAAKRQHDPRGGLWLSQMADTAAGYSGGDDANDGPITSHVAGVVRSTLILARQADTTLAIGGVVLAAGLVLQLQALWTGIAAISLGSAMLEASNAVRDSYAPTLWPWSFDDDEHWRRYGQRSLADDAADAGVVAAWSAACERSGPTWLPTRIVDGLARLRGASSYESRLRQLPLDGDLMDALAMESQQDLRLQLLPFSDVAWPQPSDAAARLEYAESVGAYGLRSLWPVPCADPIPERSVWQIATSAGQAQTGQAWSEQWQRLWTNPTLRGLADAAG